MATFEAIAVAPHDARIARKGAAWSLYQVTNDYQWFNADGRWSYEPELSKRIASGTIDIRADAPAKFSGRVGWGAHRLDIKTLDGEETSVAFDVGWSGTAGADTPDNVVVTLDKTNYTAGEEAKFRIASAFAGKATVALVGDKIERFIDVDLVSGDNVVPFAVGADWGPGAYAVALTHRPLDVGAKRMPSRALGVAWFAIDRGSHTLDVKLDAPTLVRPRQSMTLPIHLAGLAPGEDARVTVSAVDVGILNLTGFKTPDPGAYFFGQRKLPVEFRDLWGMLIDGMQGEAGAIHTGGDFSGGVEGNLPTQEPLALYSGVVKVDDQGNASVSFDLPAFNGSVRLTAVAWSKDKVGSAQADVIVRDSVVVAATLPRFLNVGDRSEMHVDIDNVEGDAGEYKLDLDIHGPLTADADSMTKTVRLDAASTPVVGDADRGRGRRRRRARPETYGAEDRSHPAFPPRRRVRRARLLPAHRDAFAGRRKPDDLRRSPRRFHSRHRLDRDLRFALWRARRAGAARGAGTLSYGCSEQTVSLAMPLLYVNRLASIEHLGVDPDLDGRMQPGDRARAQPPERERRVRHVERRQQRRRPLARRFVTDFLTRARERNFAVSSQAFDQALDRLRNEVVNTPEPNTDNSAAIAYALYVLARNGRPVIGDLRYLTDAKLDAFTSPLAKAQLAAALAMLGDQARAAAAFGAALKALDAERDGEARPDYGSRLRDAAAVLALVAEANPGNIESDAIARAGAVLEQARAERSFLSTQEMNWMTLAAEGLAEHASLAQFRVDGEVVKGALYRRWSAPTLSGQSIVIANAGEIVRAVVSVSRRRPSSRTRPSPTAMRLNDPFYKLDGTKLDALQSMGQNERVVVSLKELRRRRATRVCSSSTGCLRVSRSTIRLWSTAARSKRSPG